MAQKQSTPANEFKKQLFKVTRYRCLPLPRKPVITDEDFDSYFCEMDLPHYMYVTKRWTEKTLKIKIPNYDNYDQWLNYFKALSPSVIKQLAITGVDFLPTEAYAALSRWHDIIKSPHQIDKIHQSGLSNPTKDGVKSIIELAKANDRMGVLMALRDRLAEKLEKGTGARDTASLAKEMGEILEQISQLERRRGPDKNTKAGELLGDFDLKGRTGYNGGGARNTSFASRVTTIKDKDDEIRQSETKN